jgi:intein/homing endonuclease
MSWKKYFTPVKTTGQVSPISGNSANPTRSNYSSFLPDVYSGHPNRLERYSQYNLMSQDPEIAAALDILAEFCTQPNEENGTPFQVFFREQATSTEIKIIKKYLQQWSKLNKFGPRMFKIARNTFMYGDSFFVRDPETLQLMYVDCAKVDKIIVNESEGKKPEQYVIRDLNINFEDLTVAQINPTNQNTTPGGTAYVTGGVHQRGMVGAYPQSIGSRFEINQNQRAIEAKHVLHLSMSEGLDDNYPFGNSVLEAVFKVYKQKELLEDAIIIYRIQRAPERRIFYIDVGNMPSHLAMSFVERVKQEVNQRRIPSLTGGGCFSMDTRVPLLDGRVLTISELAEEYQQGKENWAFSCNPNTGEMVPGIISWAGVTHESADVLELQLDNGEKIICTPDHKFPIQGKGFVQAKDIVVNQDSLFKFTRQSETVQTHQVISSRKLPDTIEVGTLTIDGDEKYHNFHTFAISQGVYTKNSSVVDASYNPLAVGDDYFFPQSCLALDQHIKLLDNRSLTLAEIIQEYESGKQNYTYTVNQKTLELEPGKIVWAGVTRKNTQIVEVLLDNGEKIKTTPDHRYIMRDGSETEAQYLKPGDSLMPLYLHNAATGKNQGAEKYLRYTCPATGKKKWVHTMVCQKTAPGRKTEIHHIDLNSLNNNPTNLVEMNTAEHRELHRQLGTYHLSRAWSDPEKRAKIVSGMHQYHANASEQDKQMFRDRGLKNGAPTWQNPGSAEVVRAALRRAGTENAKNKTIKFSDGMCSRLVELYNSGYDSISKLKVILRTDEQFQTEFKKANGFLLRDKNLPDRILPTDATLVKMAQHMGYKGWDDFKKTYNKNHQVVSVTWLQDTEDTGDITIESASGSHNFALTVGVFIHNSEGRGSKVDTLPGGCLAMDTSVSLLDGRELTIREIQQEMDQGKTLWTYSCDPITGKVVPGLITWAGVTQQSAKVMRITLDNGQSVVCTPDHPFVTRHRGFSPAQDLRVGDSLMPLYRRTAPIQGKTQRDYEQFFNNETNNWNFTHRMVADNLRGTIVKEWVYDPDLNKNKFVVRHHKNFNRYDNSPENLCFINHHDHIKYHADHTTQLWETIRNTDPERYDNILKNKSKIATQAWKSHTDEEYTDRCEKISQGIVSYVAGLDAEQREKRAENSRQAFVLANQEFNRKMDSDPEFHDHVVGKRMKYWTPHNREKRAQVTGDNQRRLWSDPEYAEQARVKLAERQKPEFSENMLRFIIDQVHGKTSHQVNAMTIVEAMNANQQLLQELHDLNADKKIANLSGKFTPSILKISMMKYFGYKNWADFRRKESVHNHRIVSIEHLEEPIQVGTLTIDGQELFHDYHTFALSIGIFIKNSNLGEISDLMFFTQKLMRALRIPSSYLPTGVDDSQATFNDGRVGTAYIQELRFNKYCERLQSMMNEQFDTEFKYYLSKKGINIDFNLFDLKFNPPQNFAAYRQAEMDTARVSVYTGISQIPHLSKRFALKRFLGLTAEELAENEKLWREENVDEDGFTADARAELRSAGITPAGLAGDMDAMGQAVAPPPDQVPDDMAAQPAAGAVSTGAPSQPAAPGTPTP